jgi:hypothetical protein
MIPVDPVRRAVGSEEQMPFMLIISERSHSWAGRPPIVTTHSTREKADLLDFVKENGTAGMDEELPEGVDDKELLERNSDEMFGIPTRRSRTATTSQTTSAAPAACTSTRSGRAAPDGKERILQANGSFEAPGPVSPISDADGEAKFATAEQEAQRQ